MGKIVLSSLLTTTLVHLLSRVSGELFMESRCGNILCHFTTKSLVVSGVISRYLLTSLI
jgi:hypothetical protein